jgi:hypothetical protein
MSVHIFARMELDVQCVDLQDANIDEYATVARELRDELLATSGVSAVNDDLKQLRHFVSPQGTPTEVGAVNAAIEKANQILDDASLGFEFDDVTGQTWLDLGNDVHETETGGRVVATGYPWEVSSNLTYKDTGGSSKSGSFTANARLIVRYTTPEA